MALGKRRRETQLPLFVVAADLPRTAAHPVYERLNQLLAEHQVDPFVEGLCAKFDHDSLGRPGLAPGCYFRLLLLGYFEGIDSERGIAWRASTKAARTRRRTRSGSTPTTRTPRSPR